MPSPAILALSGVNCQKSKREILILVLHQMKENAFRLICQKAAVFLENTRLYWQILRPTGYVLITADLPVLSIMGSRL